MKKMLMIILCITFCIVLSSTAVLAINTDLYNPDPYNPSGGEIPTPLINIGNTIIGIFQVVGTIFAIAMLLWLGIRLMVASPSERADIKSRAVPYVVGAVMLFSIVNLLKIVYDIMQGI